MTETKKPVKKKTNPRTRKAPSYKSFRLSKSIRPVSPKVIPGIYKLLKMSLKLLFAHKKLFFGIILLHFVLTVIFATGLGSTFDFVTVKKNLEDSLGSNIDHSSVFVLFSYVLSSSSGGNASSGTYQFFISILVSLVLIWAIRQVLAGEKIGVKQSFYQGIYPLVQFMLVLFVFALQMVPFLIGNFLVSVVVGGGLAITAIEQSIFWLIFALLALLSLYMVMSSIFALYIVTLPGMTPLKALRSARALVLHRRISVGLRLAGLPIIGLIIYMGVLIPLIFLLPILVVPFFIALSSLSLFLLHSYLYNLYRSLL